MALDTWNNIDNFKIESEEYYCAFVDILGYKNKSDEFFSEKYNLHGRYERALNVSMKLMKSTELFSFGLVDSKLLQIKFFSDSIIVTHPKNRNARDAIYLVLMFCRILSAHLSFEGLFVRGGVSFGSHVEKENKENQYSFLSSKALEKAYKLESEKAIYPRILIDEEIVSSLSSIPKTLVVKDGDEYILHFSPQLINVNGDNLNIVKCELEDIYEIYSNEDSKRVKDKYEWLISYYYWTLTKTPNVNLNDFSKFKIGEIDRFKLLKF